MRDGDLAAVEAMAALLHPDHPERPEVFAERRALAPAHCRVLRAPGGRLLGYAVSHPWAAERGPPPLDTLLGGLPPRPDAWHLHDLALLPEARGAGHADALLEGLAGRAARAGIGVATLVAVAGKSGYWSRRRFEPAPAPGAALATYGEDAVFMRRVLRPPDRGRAQGPGGAPGGGGVATGHA